MGRVIRFHRQGPAEVLTLGEESTDPPAAGEVTLRHTAIGVNFHDIYLRSGLYPVRDLPHVPGIEGAGVIEQIGAAVEHLAIGDRVVYINPPHGSYRDRVTLPARLLVQIPDGVTDMQAAGSFLRGITAEILVNRIRPPRAGDQVLVQAVAGGVGLILCQWLKTIGCTVIGTTSSATKQRVAEEAGCDHVILYSEDDFVARVREITNGQGVPLVYDAVGKTTFSGSLDCLARRGMLINYGQSSGPPDPLPMMELARRGSLAVTRPFIWDFFQTREEFLEIADNFFRMVTGNNIRCSVHPPYPLEEAARAHQDLESRRTSGGMVLVP